MSFYSVGVGFRHTLMLDNKMLRHMGGAILSKIYSAALIMMCSQLLIEMPDWMPEQYHHPGHSFETGMDRMRFMAPLLVAALGCDPENTIRTRCQTNGIPAHLRAKATARPEDVQKTRSRGPDLREKLKEKSEVPST